MITAVQEQERQRQRARSAASSSTFSVPMMPELGAVQSLSFSSGPSCVADNAPSTAPTGSSADLGSFIGRSVGTGQCVALVKAANPSLGPASTWNAGATVQGNTSLQPGTPIATVQQQRPLRQRHRRQQPCRHLPRAKPQRPARARPMGRQQRRGCERSPGPTPVPPLPTPVPPSESCARPKRPSAVPPLPRSGNDGIAPRDVVVTAPAALATPAHPIQCRRVCERIRR